MNRTNSTKKIAVVIAVIALVAVLGVCLAACNSNSTEKKLNDKGYTVVKLNEDATGLGATVYNLVKNNSNFKEGVWATKQLVNYVAVVWYKNLDAAKDAENSFKSLPGATVYRVDKVVYVGTSQGVDDAK